jgi:hypothetical protein
VVLRAAAQKVDSLANFPFHRVHRAAVCTVYLARLAASGASAGQGVVLRRSAVRFPASSRELVRGFPWAEAETERQGARRAHQVPQPLVVSEKVLPLPENLVGVQKALMVAVHQTRPLAAPLVKVVESVWPLVVSLAALPEQRVLQPVERQPTLRLAP